MFAVVLVAVVGVIKIKISLYQKILLNKFREILIDSIVGV